MMSWRLHLNHMDDDHGVQAARETKFHHFEEREASRRSQIRRVREEREARKALLDKEADHIQFDIVRHQVMEWKGAGLMAGYVYALQYSYEAASPTELSNYDIDKLACHIS